METITFPRLLHGADYNPEQWPAAIWDEDVRLMREAHVNVATLPVFGWVSLQPDENTFTFEWLDTVIGKLWAGGVSVCLATATASQPAWLDHKYPDALTTGGGTASGASTATDTRSARHRRTSGACRWGWRRNWPSGTAGTPP